LPVVMMRSASASLSWTVPIMDALLTWPNVSADRCWAASAGSSASRRPDAASLARGSAIMGTIPRLCHRSRIAGTAVLAVILVGHSFQATFWWSVAFTALAVLPALMLPRRAAAQEQGRAAGSGTA